MCVVEVLRGRPQLALRRRKPGEAPAQLAKREFSVVYLYQFRHTNVP
jgi:hypothetical protein